MITILMCQLWTTIAGTWAVSVAASQALNFILGNTTHTINDEVNIPVFIAAGTYTLSAFLITGNNFGIGSVYLDSTLIATLDAYDAGSVVNVEKKVTGIVVPASGAKTLKLKIASKNVASSNYYFQISSMELVRTA